MPDNIILQNGDKIDRVKTINSFPINDLYYNKRTKLFCDREGAEFTDSNMEAIFGPDFSAKPIEAHPGYDEPQTDEKPQLFQPVGELDLEHIFKYHRPDPNQVDSHERVRRGGKFFASILIASTPAGADQTAAVRKIREAIMTANAAIALKGRLYKP